MARPLPVVTPRGLSRTDAAAHIGIGASLFDRLVAQGVLPRARVLGGRRIWCRLDLERAFEELPFADDGGQIDATDLSNQNEWDEA